MDYVDGFVVAVPRENKEAYKKMAEETVALFKKHGALKVVECWGDNVPDGEVTSFPKAVKLEENETVVFSWIVWPSKEVREKAWETMEIDPEMADTHKDMPFDGKRMIYGGFEMIIDS